LGKTQEFGNLTCQAVEMSTNLAKFDLTLRVIDSDQELHAYFDYAQDIFDDSTVAQMATHLERLVESLVAGPERRTRDISLLSEAERQQILVEWNRTSRTISQSCLHDLFSEQARRTPQATAVMRKGRQLSYAELE